MSATTAPTNYPALKRRLSIIRLRQRVRALCDRMGLGPSTGERLCCALIVAVIPFAVSFALSFAFHQPAGYATLQGVGAFVIVAVFLSLLIGWASDDDLAGRQAALAAALPRAEAAWLARNDEVLEELDEEVIDVRPIKPRPTTKKCRYCAEVIQAEARKCKHCGEYLDRSLREQERERALHVHGSGRSGGTAAVLEVIFGLFLGTFGIGHIYAGSVGTGLLLMFGWWFFICVAVCAGFLTLGLGWFIIPACWFLMLVLSPIMAASSVR